MSYGDPMFNPNAKAEAKICWHSECQRRAILEHVGWKWCLRHYWRMEIASRETLRRKIDVVMWTRFAR